MIVYRMLLLVTGVALTSAIESDPNCQTQGLRINNGPLIYPCVSEIILQKGQNFTLTCKGNTELQFQQQYISEEKAFSDFIINNSSSKIFKEGFTYEKKLELINVDQFAIGYYACSDNTVNVSNLLNEITKELQNTEHVSFIYIYVNGTGNLFAPMVEIVVSRSDVVLVECRPTTPDVNITLTSASENKTPKTIYSPKIGFVLNICSNVAFICQAVSPQVEIPENKRIRISVESPSKPKITAESEIFIDGETFSLNCTVYITPNMVAEISWVLPSGKIISESDKTNADNVTEGILYSTLIIKKATINNSGTYTCVSKNSCDKTNATFVKNWTKPFLKMSLIKKSYNIHEKNRIISININFDAYPKATYKILKNGLDCDRSIYKLQYRPEVRYLLFTKKNPNVADTANYTIQADNGLIKNQIVVPVFVKAAPTIYFGQSDKKCVKGWTTSITCEVSGYPLPTVSWRFTHNNQTNYWNSTKMVPTSLYNLTAYLDINICSISGVIKCVAKNDGNTTYAQRNLLVYDIRDGFGINKYTTKHKLEPDQSIWVSEDDIVTIDCFASFYDFSIVNWELGTDNTFSVKQINSSFSYVARLILDKVTLSQSGTYQCYGITKEGLRKNDSIRINVSALQKPVMQEVSEVQQSVSQYQKVNFTCLFSGTPRPNLTWFKDGNEINNESYPNLKMYTTDLNFTTVNSTILINDLQPENLGLYKCAIKNSIATDFMMFELQLKDTEKANIELYGSVIGVIILILLILIVYLTIKIKKEKRFRKELAAAGLLYFKEGVTKSINPDLGIDEQAELLPYKEEFEFPIEKLILGKQLGAGAFGVVYKAEARGIVNAEETTPVAVKMVKKTADNMYIKALASELKIMVHLGKHVNIVNLLGACTKNVGKRELVVIVEYCRYGNIHNYLQRHREVFIDQLDTDNKEKLGKVNRAYTSSSCGSTGAHSDYFGSANTQNTDNTFLNTANTVHSGRKTSEGYVRPEWRSNYESDYSYDGRAPRPLYSRDLLAWSFQIARGMEYLASRKVLHGDLAARNILLADDNIVKICDFGLAKSIYKNDEYQKKENALLPWKWLAIECMTDRIFSTQSDVWSFGIVLWELFSLAKTPYANMNPTNLLPYLTDGHRLEKPTYADGRLYDVMQRCWEAKPTQRPSFSQLQQTLGSFLEDNVRNHYVDLNSEYVDKNAKVVGQEDYLAMVSAPDYNNMVTPSPHHYVNTDRTFFPTTPTVDEEGYLQISPSRQGVFSPRLPSTEFDFDARKLNSKASEASYGSELTPMLTLSNLPARGGSESDHEGAHPPVNACPRIDEETDEVFTPCLDKNAKNAQQSAVSNPTYITFDNYEEKPKDIINYANINVPNGLVK